MSVGVFVCGLEMLRRAVIQVGSTQVDTRRTVIVLAEVYTETECGGERLLSVRRTLKPMLK